MNLAEKTEQVKSAVSGFKWWMKLGVVLLVALVGYFGYRQFFNISSSGVTYQTGSVERGTLVVSVSATGSVLSVNSSSVTTRSSGVISKVYVKDGDEVKGGQQLLMIDLDQGAKQNADAALAAYKSAQNSLANAQAGLYTAQSKEFAANQKLMNDAVERDLASDDPTYIQENADWLAAEASYKNQLETIKQAQINLSSAWLTYQQSSPIVYAPISGKVSGLSLQVGSVLSNNSSTSNTTGVTATKIANIVTDAQPTVSVNLTDIDVSKIAVGNPATVTFDAFSGKTFAGKVVSVDLVGSVTSGVTNYPVVIQLNDKTQGILPNMTATAGIITQTKDDVLMVPSEAVTTSGDQSTVQIMVNGKPQTVNVTIGLSSDTQTEIVSGLKEGDVVVTATVNKASSTARTSTTTSPFSLLGGGNRGGGAARGVNTVRIGN